MLYRILRPLLFRLDAEQAHQLATVLLATLARHRSFGLVARLIAGDPPQEDPRLGQELFGTRFPLPVGLAAGFDKGARLLGVLPELGFGFVEVGTVTPRAQEGNPRPRLFRLPHDRSLVNSLGFNNPGLEVVRSRLDGHRARVPVGVNLGKNRDTPNAGALDDYRLLATALQPHASYLVINLSSPNTPGLRELQNERFITTVFRSIRETTDVPLLLKVTPDEEEQQVAVLVEAALDGGASGIIATNTTNDPELLAQLAREGGVSGALLRHRARATLSHAARAARGRCPLIAVGGIDSAAEAYGRIRAGASLVQLYTALIFEGPTLVGRIHRELLEWLARDGFSHVGQAIGVDA